MSMPRIMKHHVCCIVPNCPGRNKREIQLHKFPEKSQEKDLWCKNIGVATTNVRSTARICSRHFDDMHRVGRRLKFGAQPTLNLVVSNPYCESPDSNIRKCAIQACPTTEPPNTLFSFPQDDQKRLEWIKACGMESKSQTNPLFICAEHFEPNMIMGNKLKCNAFPKQPDVLFKKEQEIDIVDCEQLEDPQLSEDVNNSSNREYCNNCDFYKKENDKERTLNKVKSQEITKLKKKIVQLQAEIEMWRDMVREATEDALYAENIVI